MKCSIKADYPMIDTQATAMHFKTLMIQKGITVRDICKYLGLASLQSVYHWLEGRSLPSVDNLYALSVLFGVTMDSIIKGNWEDRKSIDRPRVTSACERLTSYFTLYSERIAV